MKAILLAGTLLLAPLSAHVPTATCALVQYSDIFEMTGTGYAAGHVYYVRLEVPRDREIAQAPQATPQGNIIAAWESDGPFPPGTYSALVWTSRAAYRDGKANIAACSTST